MGQLRIVFDKPLALHLMILHCSQKLAAKLTGLSPVPLEETSPLGSWHGHLFTLDRRQCALFCHDASRYVLFLPGLRKVELALGPMHFDTATDRSVQSSLRVAQQTLEAWNVMNLDPLAMSCRLNERPATVYGKWLHPDRAMLEAVAAL